MEDLDTFLTTRSVLVDTLCKHHRLSLPKRPLPAPRLGVSEVITLTLFGQWSRFSPAMRNELVEELLIDPEKKVLQNRMGSSSETVKTDEMENNTARREKAEKTSVETRA